MSPLPAPQVICKEYRHIDGVVLRPFPAMGKALNGLWVLLLAGIGWAGIPEAKAEAWQVQRSLVTERRAWTAKYELKELAEQYSLLIRVSLMPSDRVNRVALQKRVPAWQQAIEETWRNRFSVSIDDRELPLEIRVKFTHHDPHHRVVVRPGNWQPNQHNWYVDTPPHVVAHEIGHMLGAYDEYRGGALNPATALIDINSIMGKRRPGGEAYPRHLWLIREEIADHLDAEVEIQVAQAKSSVAEATQPGQARGQHTAN